MALNNWERFVSVLLEPSHHFENLLAQPMRLEILMNIFATSQFLADILVRSPENFEWATDQANLRSTRQREDLDQELAGIAQACPDIPAWLNALCRFRSRELLRIGTRDVCLHAPIREITLDLSTLADALIDTALHRAWENIPNAADQFCILAFGKLGGEELNYSSDIDLLALYKESEPPNDEATEIFDKVMGKACSYLSQYTDEGFLYRVDLRLRPYGREGLLVQSFAGLMDYYQRLAVLPEIQSLLKLRPVAGSLRIGEELLQCIQPLLREHRRREDIAASIESMRRNALKLLTGKSELVRDVKSGLGGLRDLEFMVQGLQLQLAPDHPEVLGGNTLAVLKALTSLGIFTLEVHERLRQDYIFLRRVEHYLQILEDRQIHSLPTEASELTALAKRMMGIHANADDFVQELERRMVEVREAYLKYLIKG